MTQQIQLWGRTTSINVQKVAWVIGELGLPHARIDAGGVYGGLDDAAYIALNPNRKIPTLVDGDLVLWESNAICRYLVETYGVGSTLRGDSAGARAQADMWMEWFQSTLYANTITLFYQCVRLPPSQRDPAIRAAALAALAEPLAMFDAALADRAFILGDDLSLGDIPMGASLYRYYTLDIDHPTLPNLERYYDALTTRPTYQAGVMVEYDSLKGSD